MVTTRTIGVANMLSADVLELARSLEADGFHEAAAETLAAASLLQQAAARVLDALERQRAAMLEDDNP